MVYLPSGSGRDLTMWSVQPTVIPHSKSQPQLSQPVPKVKEIHNCFGDQLRWNRHQPKQRFVVHQHRADGTGRDLSCLQPENLPSVYKVDLEQSERNRFIAGFDDKVAFMRTNKERFLESKKLRDKSMGNHGTMTRSAAPQMKATRRLARPRKQRSKQMKQMTRASSTRSTRSAWMQSLPGAEDCSDDFHGAYESSSSQMQSNWSKPISWAALLAEVDQDEDYEGGKKPYAKDDWRTFLSEVDRAVEIRRIQHPQIEVGKYVPNKALERRLRSKR